MPPQGLDMLDALKPYKLAVEIGLLVLAVLGMAAAVHKYNAWQQGIGADRVQAEWDRQKLTDKEAQNARETLLQQNVDNARADAAQARQLAASAAGAAAGNSRVFSGALAAVSARAATDSRDALASSVATLTTVLDNCQQRYIWMAGQADGHAADSLMYQRAWPQNPPTGDRK